MKKFIKSVLCTGLCLCIAAPAISAQTTEIKLNEATVDAEKCVVTVSGNIGTAAKTRVGIVAYAPDMLESNADYAERIIYTGQVQSANDGSFNAVFAVPEYVDVGILDVVVSYTGNDTPATDEIFYFPKTAAEDICGDIVDAGTSDEVALFLDSETNRKGLQLDCTFYDLIDDKSALYLEIAGMTEGDADDLQTLFLETSIAEAFVAAKSGKTMENFLNTAYEAGMQDMLGINETLDGYYKHIAEDVKSSFLSTLEASPAAGYADVKKAIRKNIADYIFYVSRYGDVKSIIEVLNAEGITNIDLSRLDSVTDKDGVMKELAGKSFAGSSVEDAYNAAILKYSNQTQSSGGIPSGGGGGGGGRTTSVRIDTATVKNNITTPEEPKKLFSDIQNVTWAENAILNLAAKGVISGYDENRFMPDKSITRAEFSKLILTAFELDRDDLDCSFEDVSPDAWYYRYVATAYMLGIVKGISETEFAPETVISRQDAAIMLSRAMDICDIEKTAAANEKFGDDEDISEYAKTAVYELCAGGIINGMGDGSFAPKANISRAQAAVMLWRVLQAEAEV